MPFWRRKTAADWLDNAVSSASISGDALESIKRQNAVKELALYTAVGLVADIVSSCEVQVFEDGKTVHNGTWYTFNVSANPNNSAQDLMREWIVRLYYKGEGLLVPLSKHVYVAESYSRNEYPVKGDTFEGVIIGDYPIDRKFKADNVYFLKQKNPELRKLVNAVFESYGELLDSAESAAEKSSGEKYALQIGNFPSGAKEQQDAYLDDVTNQLSSFVSSKSAAYPLTRGQTLTKISGSSGTTTGGTSEYMSLRKDVYDMVASALHIPVGLLDGNITSVDQIINQTLTFAIGPLAKKISSELTRKTYTQDEISYSGCKIVVDTTAIKHIDVIDMADKTDKLISSGIMSIDEVRRRCNLPEIGEEWSTKHYITKNYENIDGVSEPSDEGGERQ